MAHKRSCHDLGVQDPAPSTERGGQSFLLRRWNYAGSLVFVVWRTSWQDGKKRQELRRDKPASSWDLGTALQQAAGFQDSRGSAWRLRQCLFRASVCAIINNYDLHCFCAQAWGDLSIPGECSWPSLPPSHLWRTFLASVLQKGKLRL